MLLRSLQSVLCQLDECDEIIVVNDDRENSIKLDHPILDDNHKVKIITNEFESGPSGARNFGVSRSSNSYVMFLDDDDVMQNGYLASVKLSLIQHPEFAYGGAHMKRVHDNENFRFWLDRRELELGKVTKKSIDKLIGTNCGLWVNRSAFLKVGGFNTSLINSEDNDLCVRLYGHNFKCLRQSQNWIFVFSAHLDEQPNITSTTMFKKKLDCWWSVYESSKKYFGPFHPIRIELLERYTRRAFREKMGQQALKNFSQSSFDLTILLGYLYSAYLSIKYRQK